jgi:uncharacterized protein YecE (DUF72 family)
VRIGTSGWQYRDWRDVLYPRGVPTRRWLATYADAFDTVEVNNTFYRLPERNRFEAWADEVPDDFTFAVKASRYITHIRRLRDVHEPVDTFVARAAGLGEKLGPVLLQLPPNLTLDCDALAAALAAFPPAVRVAVEFRHPSWDDPDVDAVLAARDASCVLADRRGRVTGRRTATWAYVRFHEGRATPPTCYGKQALRTWATRLRELWAARADGYVYFNNDHLGCAVRNAQQLRALA